MQVAAVARADQVLRIKNTTPTDQVLWIEPLGDRVILRSNVLYELIGSDEFGKMEIDLTQDGFIVHGWVKKVMALHGGGKDLVEWELRD
jgi:hypothetical protein